MTPARAALVVLLPALAVGLMVLALFGQPVAALFAALLAAGASGLAAYLAFRPFLLRLSVIEAAVRALQPGEPAKAFLPHEEDDALEQLTGELHQMAGRFSSRVGALAGQENTLSAVLDSMAEGVWVTDGEGTIVRHNDALKELLYAGQSLLGQRPLALLRNDALNAAVMRACHEGVSTRLEVTVEGVRPRILSANVRPLGRELKGSAAVFHDITELRRLEAVRKDFVANVSHELRTPITAIRGYAETLKGGALHDEKAAPQMVEIIHRQSERLSELVSDLLELSTIESGQLQLSRESVGLADVAARAADAIRQKADDKRVQVQLAVPAGLSAKGDARAIEQVLLNLLDNAVKYTPPGGRVQLSGSTEGGRSTIEVQDSGVGIEAKHLPRVFERFYRVDKGRSRDMGGTGLGLSIVKHLATAMGGDVRVTSQPGKGSTFTVVLPGPSDEQVDTAG